MNRKTGRLVLILLMVCFYGYGQSFSLLQVNQVQREVNHILQVFSRYSAFVPEELPQQEVPSEFNALFRPEAIIFNFLEPDAGKQQVVSPVDYYRYIREHYPSGLSFEMYYSLGKMSKPLPTDAQYSGFVTYVPVSVKAIGLFDGHMINNVTGDYYAIIGFRMKDGQVYDAAIHYIQAERPMMRYARKADILLGSYAAPAFTRIYSRDIFNDEIWDAWGEFRYRAGLKLLYRTGQHLGFFTGVGVSSYSSVYEIREYDNEDLEKTVKTDIDGDHYLEFIRASVTETNTLTCLDIPLGIRYSTSGNKIRLVLQAGFELSFLLSSRFSATGFSDHRGYYPDYHVVLYELPDYGFTAEPVDKNDKWELNPVNLSLSVSAGAEIPLGKHFSLTVAPFATTGLSDLGYELSRYRDDYISISGNPGKLSTRSAGVLLELFLKL